MKKFILAILILSLMVSTVFAGEIIPTNPIEVLPPAVKVVDYSIEFIPDAIAVKFDYYDATDNIVKTKWVTITGEDYTTLINAKVQAVHVGQKFSYIMFKAIRNKCKDILAIEGTVN